MTTSYESDVAERRRQRQATIDQRTFRYNPATDGVTVSFLMEAFRLSRYKVEKALRRIRPTGYDRHSSALYDLAEAAACLVEPNFDVTDYLDRLKPEQLPEKMREGYWNAKLKQLRFEERAGQLWRTELVFSIYSEILQDIRTKLRILPDTIDRTVGLSNAQVTKVTRIVDKLQEDIHKHILDFAKKGNSLNRLGEEEDQNTVVEDDEDII